MVKNNLIRGYSLIEVLLVSIFSALLLLSIGEIYLTTKRTFLIEQAVLNLQMEGIYAVNYLNQTIRMAGDVTCSGDTWPLVAESFIRGYRHQLPHFLTNSQIIPATDVLVIAGCNKLAGREQELKTAFYIADTGRKNKLGGKIYGLFEQIEGSRRIEIISNIYAMNIKYGVAAVGAHDISQYLLAEQISAEHWHQVRSIEINLLFKSEEPILSQAKSYSFANQVLPKSKFLYQTLPTYIALREKL